MQGCCQGMGAQACGGKGRKTPCEAGAGGAEMQSLSYRVSGFGNPSLQWASKRPLGAERMSRALCMDWVLIV